VWSADTGSTGGSNYSVTSAISGTTTPALYQSEHYGTFAYQFALANGTYNVNLKFAELYFTTAGQRVFNVAINGQSVLSNFDVVSAAGSGLKAVDRAFSVNVTGGQIAIALSAVTSDVCTNMLRDVSAARNGGSALCDSSSNLAESRLEKSRSTSDCRYDPTVV